MDTPKPPVIYSADPVVIARPADSKVSKNRIAIAMSIAVISDLLGFFVSFAPPLEWALDFVTAFLLFLVLGRQWLILPGLIAEAIPGVAIFPAWILVVASIAVWGHIKPVRPKV
jgi:hypothetical protein